MCIIHEAYRYVHVYMSVMLHLHGLNHVVAPPKYDTLYPDEAVTETTQDDDCVPDNDEEEDEQVQTTVTPTTAPAEQANQSSGTTLRHRAANLITNLCNYMKRCECSCDKKQRSK